MTEKRFNFVGGYLYDVDNCIGYVEDVKFRQDYEDIVNALHEENEQLKKEYREMEIKVGKLKGEIGELFCENEQLKQENERLCNFNLHMLLDEKNKEIEQLKQQLIDKERMLDVRDKIIADVMKAVNGDFE